MAVDMYSPKPPIIVLESGPPLFLALLSVFHKIMGAIHLGYTDIDFGAILETDVAADPPVNASYLKVRITTAL